MRIFQELELAPTCLVSEACAWVALGRPPEFIMGDKNDRRGETDWYDGGNLDLFPFGYYKEEFSEIDPSVDFDEYRDIFDFEKLPPDAPYWSTIEDQDKAYEYLSENYEKFEDAFKEKEDARNRYLSKKEKLIDWSLERAILSVLKHIFSGEIKTYGFEEKKIKNNEWFKLGDVRSIEKTDWLVDKFDLS